MYPHGISAAPPARAGLLNSVVLLDLGLPRESGLSLLGTMRGRYDVTPVLILTARGQMSERIAGLDAGADHYLAKPFDFGELWARVRAVMSLVTGGGDDAPPPRWPSSRLAAAAGFPVPERRWHSAH